MEESKVMHKKGYKNLFENLQQHNIPVFTFLDEIGDVLGAWLGRVLSIKLVFIIQISKSCSFPNFDEDECSKDLKEI